MELCREVGKSFEAVIPACLTKESVDEESEVNLHRQRTHLSDVCLVFPIGEF
jgi:hypothetical protein